MGSGGGRLPDPWKNKKAALTFRAAFFTLIMPAAIYSPGASANARATKREVAQGSSMGSGGSRLPDPWKNKKAALTFRAAFFTLIMPAAIYSPMELPPQYHRRYQA